jgi:glycerol 3-phosphatase-2
MLSPSDRLCDVHDVAMLDLDGVVYIGGQAVPGAPEHLARAREVGLHLAFITNNASRPPEKVARILTDLGVPTDPSDVVTSAQAAATVLADRLPEGSRVLLLGGPGLEIALKERGLTPVTDLADEPVAVASGYGPDLLWREIMQAAVRIREGLPWVASNTDMSIPTDFGIGPGHGVLVKMLQDFTGVTPMVAGKPERPLLEETIRREGAERPLMVGDRLDTDIEGATNAGIPSLLVLTGVTDLATLVAAEPRLRPSYLASDLGGLLQAHPEPTVRDGAWACGGWSATVVDGHVEVDGDGGRDDWWRAVASAAWSHLDATGHHADVAGLAAPRQSATDRTG